MPKSQAAPKLQIFASDIDEEALQIARLGRFPASIATNIPAMWLERYFVRVRQEARNESKTRIHPTTSLDH